GGCSSGGFRVGSGHSGGAVRSVGRAAAVSAAGGHRRGARWHGGCTVWIHARLVPAFMVRASEDRETAAVAFTSRRAQGGGLGITCSSDCHRTRCPFRAGPRLSPRHPLSSTGG